jgi:hypothetical protein
LEEKSSQRIRLSAKEDIMSVFRYLAPLLCLLFGLYCLMWGLVASTFPTPQRVGGAFVGALLLLLALVYVRVILPREREEVVRPDEAR